MAPVKNTRSFQTTGELFPANGTGVFQRIPLPDVASQVVGRSLQVVTPVPSGPRNRGQTPRAFPAVALATGSGAGLAAWAIASGLAPVLPSAEGGAFGALATAGSGLAGSWLRKPMLRAIAEPAKTKASPATDQRAMPASWESVSAGAICD